MVPTHKPRGRAAPLDYRKLIEDFLESQGLVGGVGPGWYSFLWASDYIFLNSPSMPIDLAQQEQEAFREELASPERTRYPTRDALIMAAWADWKTRNEERDTELETYQESTTDFLRGCEDLGITIQETVISRNPEVARYAYAIGKEGAWNGDFASHGDAVLAAVRDLISEATGQRMMVIIAGIGQALGFDLWDALEEAEWRTTPIENLPFIITRLISEQATKNSNAWLPIT